MSDQPKGIGQKLRVRDLKPGMTVGLKQVGESFVVVTVAEIARFAVIFEALGDKLIFQRTGDDLDSITHNSFDETHMFEYTP